MWMYAAFLLTLLSCAGGCHLLLPFSGGGAVRDGVAMDLRPGDLRQIDAARGADQRASIDVDVERKLADRARSDKTQDAAKQSIRVLNCSTNAPSPSNPQVNASSGSAAAGQLLVLSVAHFGAAAYSSLKSATCSSCPTARALTLGAMAQHPSRGQVVEIWYLTDAPPSSTIDLVFSGPVTPVVFACYFGGVSSSSPTQGNTVQTMVPSQTTASYTFSTEPGAWVIDLVAWSPSSLAGTQGLKPITGVPAGTWSLGNNRAAHGHLPGSGAVTPGGWMTTDGVAGDFTIAAIALPPGP